MNYLSKSYINLYPYPYPHALSDGLSHFRMISIFFGSFFVILNWHHRCFTHISKTMKKTKITVPKPPGCPGQELSLLSCRCHGSAVWHWVSKEASRHHTRQVRRTKDEAESCGQFAMWLRADPSTFVPCSPLSAPLIKPRCLSGANSASSVVFDNVMDQQWHDICSKLLNVFICYFVR